MATDVVAASPNPGYPFAKEVRPSDGTLRLQSVRLVAGDAALSSEREVFTDSLKERGIGLSESGTPVRISVSKLDLPIRESRYRAQLLSDSYELSVRPDGVAVRGASPAGVFNGLMAVVRALGQDGSLPCAEVRDWPDLPTRMIMVDPARQNENFDYYRRVIRHVARYGINAILVHITDDQTACLYQPDYPELMHAHAWKRDEIRDLVAYARRHHVELIPEVESFGHSRMFTRREDFREFLHEDRRTTRVATWTGTDIPGYTNVLCPASDKAYEYLDRMYAAAAEGFDNPVLHLGFDEVDMSSCTRCETRFPGITREEWFRGHMLRCRDHAIRHGRKAAFWGDMLLSHPDIMDGLPTSGTIIYDWHYKSEVSPDSSALFDARGFEVVASPALVCYPHAIIPDSHNYQNIRNFAAIARKQDLAGLNTTIWIPQRYMSDVLWTAIAYAGAEAWGGGNLVENDFLAQAASDLFGLAEGPRFAKVWMELAGLVGHLDEVQLAAWADEEGLGKARKAEPAVRAQNARRRSALLEVRKELDAMERGVRREREAYRTIGRSADIVRYLLERLEAASDPQVTSPAVMRKLDVRCVEIIGWIEEDWNRNRFAGDPNMDGLYLPGQHLLNHFRQMHRFHQALPGGKK
jgi:hypothetical protein